MAEPYDGREASSGSATPRSHCHLDPTCRWMRASRLIIPTIIAVQRVYQPQQGEQDAVAIPPPAALDRVFKRHPGERKGEMLGNLETARKTPPAPPVT